MHNTSNLISIQKVARQLGVSVADVKELIRQGILHPKTNEDKDYLFFRKDIEQIRSNKNLTLSEEAAQVGIQIEREVVTSVSNLQKLRRRVSLSVLVIFFFLFLLVVIIAFLFKVYPDKTSDFFGYYYRFNANAELRASVLGSSTDSGVVLQAATGPAEAPIKTSVLADVLKPVAATSLVVVKAVDSQIYEQIVTNPVLASDLPGPAGPPGVAGAPGSAGVAASDVMNSVGDLTIKDANNTTSRLAVGSEDQILTVSNGVPVWEGLDASRLTGIANASLANSSLSVISGTGLSGGGEISLGGSSTLNIGAGSGIITNANDIALNLTQSGTSGLSSSNSGLEVSSSGLTLLKGCADNEILKWTDAGDWACAADLVGSDLQHAASYDTDDSMTNITSSQTILGTVSVTPVTATADVYVTGQAEVFSSNATDQPFSLTIETTSDCTGLTVGNAAVTYTITSGANNNNMRGVLVVSGVALNPGTSPQAYSLCASTSAGDSNVQNWRIEALVIDSGAN